MERRKPYLRMAKPADRYTRPNERIAAFGGPFGGGLMLVKNDASGEQPRTVVELFRLDPNTLVRVPTVNLPERQVEVENLVAYAAEVPDATVVLTDGGTTARLTIRQARSLARELLREAARAADLAVSPGPSREYAEGDSDPTPGILPADAATIIGREVRAEADRTREQLGAEATLADYIVDAVRRLSSLLRSDAAPVGSDAP